MAEDNPARNGALPHPFTPTPIQHGAEDSWRDFHKHGSSTPGEALGNDPRKHPIDTSKA